MSTTHCSLTMNDIVALSHMKLAALSSGQSRVDAALLHKSILIVNALEAHHAAYYSQERRFATPSAVPVSDKVPLPSTPKLAPISEEEDPIDLDHIFLEPAVTSSELAFTYADAAAEITHVEVLEVGESDDDYDRSDDSDDDAFMASSTSSVVSFTTVAGRQVANPTFALSYPCSTPVVRTCPVYDDFSDSDGDEDAVITPPQPVLLDDFKGDCDFGAYDADELDVVAGLSLFGVTPARA